MDTSQIGIPTAATVRGGSAPIVDSALDELPVTLGDVVYLVDIEEHSLSTASSLLGAASPTCNVTWSKHATTCVAGVNRYLASH